MNKAKHAGGNIGDVVLPEDYLHLLVYKTMKVRYSFFRRKPDTSSHRCRGLKPQSSQLQAVNASKQALLKAIGQVSLDTKSLTLFHSVTILFRRRLDGDPGEGSGLAVDITGDMFGNVKVLLAGLTELLDNRVAFWPDTRSFASWPIPNATRASVKKRKTL